MGSIERTGAFKCDYSRETRSGEGSYANDLSNPQHLIAVKGGLNGSEVAKEPAEPLTPNSAYWCTYLAD